MNFVLNGRTVELDAATVRARVLPSPPDPIRTHWVEIDGLRWPPKQAFRIATGLIDEPFISHFALRVFQRLGFVTSRIPGDVPHTPKQVTADPTTLHTDEDALEAFRRLDHFLASNLLTPTLAALEAQLQGISKAAAADLGRTTGFDEDLVDAALVVRERVGMLDTLIHAAVITQPRVRRNSVTWRAESWS